MATYTTPKKKSAPGFIDTILAIAALKRSPSSPVKELMRLRTLHGSKLGKSDRAVSKWLTLHQYHHKTNTRGLWLRDDEETGTRYVLFQAGLTMLDRYSSQTNWDPDIPFSPVTQTLKEGEGFSSNRETENERERGEGLTATPSNLRPEGPEPSPPPVEKMDFFSLDQVFASCPIIEGPETVPEVFKFDEKWRGGRHTYAAPGAFSIALQGGFAVIRPEGQVTAGDIDAAVGAIARRLTRAREYLSELGYEIGEVRKLSYDREASSQFLRDLAKVMPAGVQVIEVEGGSILFNRSGVGGEISSRDVDASALRDVVEMRGTVRELRGAFKELAGLMIDRLTVETEREKLEAAAVLRSLRPGKD